VRRALLAAPVTFVALAVQAVLGCGGAKAAKAPSVPPLHLAPATDLAQGAGLQWIIDVAPRELAAAPDVLPALDALLPRAEVAAFADRNGGVDPLSLAELVIAAYAGDEGSTTLYIARGSLTPERIETSFRQRAESVEGRAVDREDDVNGIVRTWGMLRGERAQIATFEREAAALEIGRFGPLRVAELYAQGRLRRAAPALKMAPLPRAAELLRGAGDATDPPVRAFALGPFEGASAKGLGGLFAASTSVALSARPSALTGAREPTGLACVLVLTGGWGPEAPAAAERLRAAWDALTATALGRLAGLDHPLQPPVVSPAPDSLRLTVALDPVALARGLRAAMGAEIGEIMRY
jgi:hypothetical protein